ncbi:hypothetical protein DFH07DRAFT_780443 [Mycena maculata]|uniref:Aminoglycoside phosphotransferase domain-containing protein n=1 Tax=Mycena maculata TaxID=230809 RepID=A0AAD7I311_9AGAR|nr:hypothetical protein DFH07DRAFT_780443 [Mycena maculata]
MFGMDQNREDPGLSGGRYYLGGDGVLGLAINVMPRDRVGWPLLDFGLPHTKPHTYPSHGPWTRMLTNLAVNRQMILILPALPTTSKCYATTLSVLSLSHTVLTFRPWNLKLLESCRRSAAFTPIPSLRKDSTCSLLFCAITDNLLDGTDVIACLAGSALNDNAECAEDALTQSILSEARLSKLLSLGFVATLAFVKQHTSIPVPKVHHLESSSDNLVGARYMITVRILGHPLGTTWYTMSSQQGQQVVTQLAGIEAELLNIRFPAIGCLVDASGIRAWWSNINGGVDGISTSYAIQWFQFLLDGVNSLAPEEFGPQDFSFFHDDMGNILVSNCGTVVDIIDWEGSRICPLWNKSRYSTFLRDPRVLVDESEVVSLQKLQKGAIERKTGKKYPGSSPLRLGTLLYMVDYTRSVRSSRATMDNLFLAWFNVITEIGYVRGLKPFLPLKRFIENTKAIRHKQLPPMPPVTGEIEVRVYRNSDDERTNCLKFVSYGFGFDFPPAVD